MTTPLVWKVHHDGTLIAATRHAEDAAVLVAAIGVGAVVRVERRIVWREGLETASAGDSYDAAAGVMEERRARHARLAFESVYGGGKAAPEATR